MGQLRARGRDPRSHLVRLVPESSFGLLGLWIVPGRLWGHGVALPVVPLRGVRSLGVLGTMFERLRMGAQEDGIVQSLRQGGPI